MSNANEKQNIDEFKVHNNAWQFNDKENNSVRVMKIPDLDYWASYCGHIFSKKNKKLRMLKEFDNGNGYLKVGISTPQGMSTRFVHRLVADAWLEKTELDYWGNPRNEINHLNGDKANNSPLNLERCSKFENMEHLSGVLKSNDFRLKNI